MPQVTLSDGSQKNCAQGDILSEVIGSEEKLHMPCGGKKKCAKCLVHVSGELSEPEGIELLNLTEEQRKNGIRLACCARVLGDCEVLTSADDGEIVTPGVALPPDIIIAPDFEKYGIAIDIGTTTMSAMLCDRHGLLADAGTDNPQSEFGADVISRIERSLGGDAQELAKSVITAIDELTDELTATAKIDISDIERFVIVGNTAMMYLLTGKNPVSLSAAPFEADCLFDYELSGAELGIKARGASVYLPRCISAFVGADITAAILAAGQDDKTTTLLADIGTNGEVSLFHGDEIVCCSTAAGPAFEGAQLHSGMHGRQGAIDSVELRGDTMADIVPHVIGGVEPKGICGSGVIDLLAALLKTEDLDETGILEEEPTFGDVIFTQKDVRQIQLAKGAVSAGIESLMAEVGVGANEVETFFIAGGFGSYIDIENAAAIGLIPSSLTKKAEVLGNAALAGGAMMLLNPEYRKKSSKQAKKAKTVDLSQNPIFIEKYTEGMFF